MGLKNSDVFFVNLYPFLHCRAGSTVALLFHLVQRVYGWTEVTWISLGNFGLREAAKKNDATSLVTWKAKNRCSWGMEGNIKRDKSSSNNNLPHPKNSPQESKKPGICTG